MRYSFNSRIRYSEVGADYNLTMLSLLDYFQDASIFNSEAVGRDFRVLDRENRAWFLADRRRPLSLIWRNGDDFHLAL